MTDRGNDPGDFAALVDDRPKDGVFQVDRRVYNDPEIKPGRVEADLFDVAGVFGTGFPRPS